VGIRWSVARRILNKNTEAAPERVEGEVTVSPSGDVVIGAPTAEAVVVLTAKGDALFQ
jgi:hypothetical protein